MNPVAKHVCKTFWYLATPYRTYPGGREQAHKQACALTAYLMVQDVRVFCPIAHTHCVSECGLDPVDHDFWMYIDRPFMETASGIIVAKLPGWENSAGIAEEIEAFESMNKPVVMWDEPGSVPR